MTVNFGTRAFATAITILAPSRARPRFSYSRPTMNPVMFCRNTSGIRAFVAQLDEVRALQALSLNRIPLLATMPTG